MKRRAFSIKERSFNPLRIAVRQTRVRVLDTNAVVLRPKLTKKQKFCEAMERSLQVTTKKIRAVTLSKGQFDWSAWAARD
jgi:hypothetical protein